MPACRGIEQVVKHGRCVRHEFGPEGCVVTDDVVRIASVRHGQHAYVRRQRFLLANHAAPVHLRLNIAVHGVGDDVHAP